MIAAAVALVGARVVNAEPVIEVSAGAEAGAFGLHGTYEPAVRLHWELGALQVCPSRPHSFGVFGFLAAGTVMADGYDESEVTQGGAVVRYRYGHGRDVSFDLSFGTAFDHPAPLLGAAMRNRSFALRAWTELRPWTTPNLWVGLALSDEPGLIAIAAEVGALVALAVVFGMGGGGPGE